MKLELYQIDAFTDKIFSGNPACVVPLNYWLPNDILLKIAKENAVAETAFFVDKGDKIHLRWFTPEIEMDLCGHATLATAHCLKTILNYRKDKIIFETLSGDLTVIAENDFYYLDFPSRMPIESTLPENISKSLNIQPKEVLKSRDYVLLYDSEEDIKNILINPDSFSIFVETRLRETSRPNFKIHQNRSDHGRFFPNRNSNQNLSKRRTVKPSEFLQP